MSKCERTDEKFAEGATTLVHNTDNEDLPALYITGITPNLELCHVPRPPAPLLRSPSEMSTGFESLSVITLY